MRFLYKALRSPNFWRVLKPLVCLYVSRERNRPFTLWVEFLCWVLGEASKRKRPVVWINSFFPVEFVYGLGAVPFLPELFSAIVAYFNWTRGPILKGSSLLSTDVCSFYRCAMGLLDYEVLPTPDLIISCSQICDGTKAFYEVLSHRMGVSHLLLDVPYRKDKRAKAYIKDQLIEIFEEARRLLDLRTPVEELKRSLEIARGTESVMREVAKLRRAVPAPFPGSEGMSYVAGMSFWSLGSERGLRFFEALRDRILRRVKERRGYLPEERFRVLWLHHIRPYYPNPIVSFLNEKGVAIAYEEVNYPWWPVPRGDDPFEDLAEKICANPWGGPIEGRIELVERLVEDYRIHGVIHFSHWGCRQSTGGAMVIGEVVKRRGIPYLILPGDGADPDNYSPGQTMTRLQAFLEVLQQRWRFMRV
ncbi:MAG: hypothetical protein DRG31_00380 [Deltaproteobacteria bacterium]|nr:MAG: hypothetical protein DRG31_00380 [Deltaproteobacteria bacterium]